MKGGLWNLWPDYESAWVPQVILDLSRSHKVEDL